MALISWLHGSHPPKSDIIPGKIQHFGAHFDGHIFLETATLRPYAKIKGKLYIETRFMLKFKGIHVQLEADLYAKFSSESGRNIHRKRVCILENTEIRKNGDQLSPIRDDVVPQVPEGQGNDFVLVIHPEHASHNGDDLPFSCEYFSFALTAPGEQLPQPFKNSYGSLEYKVVAYMLSVDDRYVKVAEHPMEFSGYLNLYGRKDLLNPVRIKKGLHTGNANVHADFVLENGAGYLSGVPVPFTMTVRNPQCIPLRILVYIALKITYNVDGVLLPICSRVDEVELHERKPEGNTLWKGTLTVPKDQCCSYHDKNPAYDVRYAIQFKVNVENHGIIKGTHLLIVGTTRESPEVIKEKVENAQELENNPWVEKRGMNTSVKSEGGYRVRQGSMGGGALRKKLNMPSYSQVNSPVHSMEALHKCPAYLDHLDFVNEETATPMMSANSSARGSFAD